MDTEQPRYCNMIWPSDGGALMKCERYSGQGVTGITVTIYLHFTIYFHYSHKILILQSQYSLFIQYTCIIVTLYFQEIKNKLKLHLHYMNTTVQLLSDYHMQSVTV